MNCHELCMITTVQPSTFPRFGMRTVMLAMLARTGGSDPEFQLKHDWRVWRPGGWPGILSAEPRAPLERSKSVWSVSEKRMHPSLN
jgi:hypothetical protein